MKNYSKREAKNLSYRNNNIETDCQQWQDVASKLYRALVVEKNRRGIRWQDAEMIAEALEAYEKIA